jgi:hypothetical protein
MEVKGSCGELKEANGSCLNASRTILNDVHDLLGGTVDSEFTAGPAPKRANNQRMVQV